MATWRAGLFDRLMPNDLGLSEDDRDKLGRQGLLSLGLGLLTNGGGFGNALGQGIQSGLLAMNAGAEDISQRQYRRDLSARMKSNTDAEAAKRLLAGQLLNPDGTINTAKYNQYASLDPQGAKAFRDATQPEQVKWSYGEMQTPSGGTVPIFHQGRPGTAVDVVGNPLFGGQPQRAAPAGATGFGSLFETVPGLRVTSTTRTPEQNAKVGGVANSYHLTGEAIDIGRPSPEQRQQVNQWAAQNGYEVIDNYRDGHVHLEPAGPRKVASADPFAGRPGYVAPKPEKGPAQKRRLTPQELAAAGYPEGSIVQRNEETGDEDVVFKPSERDANGGKALPQGTVEKLTGEAEKLVNLTELAGGFSDKYAGYKFGGSVANAAGRLGIGEAADGQAQWWQQYDRHKNVVRNELFGASLTEGEKQAFEAADVNPNMSAAVIRQNLAKQQQILRRALKRKADVWRAQGYNADAINAATGMDATAPATGTGRKLRFNPKTGKIE